MSQRRSRFTVTTLSASGDPVMRVILCYSAQGARDHYARRGVEVVRVEAGDFRQKIARLSATAPSNPLRLHEANLLRAREFLGLAQPLAIRFNGRRGPVNGSHRNTPLADGGWQHRIMVKSYLDPREAGEVLWHELGHALQFERDVLSLGLSQGESLARWHRSYRDGTSYTQKPYEVEARSYEQHNAELPLFHS